MRKQRKIPLRKCIASLGMFPKKELIRVVRTVDDEVLIDPTGKMSGRGAYLRAEEEYIGLAQKKKALEHSLKVTINPGIYDELREYAKKVSIDE